MMTPLPLGITLALSLTCGSMPLLAQGSYMPGPMPATAGTKQDPTDMYLEALRLCYVGINKISSHKVSLCAHNRFCTLSVSVCDLVIMRHTLVHLFQLFVKISAFPVKHHKYRWGAKRPASVTSDTDGRSCHLLAGTAVKLTHSRNIIVHKKALDQVAFAQKISSLFLRQLWMFSDGCQKKFFQFQHFGNLMPGKHTAHQHQDCKRI